MFKPTNQCVAEAIRFEDEHDEIANDPARGILWQQVGSRLYEAPARYGRFIDDCRDIHLAEAVCAEHNSMFPNAMRTPPGKLGWKQP
ncbi:MAG TPA: hypothetical protein VH020_09285 [Stellaceae bacterium]|jgi:hypothetical protein|nr:hypothetical protein [Stellaceae bacterium]